MKVIFSKYQGAGNDFVMLNNMLGDYDSLSVDQIQFICDRKIGVGGDGLIKLNRKEGFDFEVDYYNADGSQSFCGNGARCSVAFAKSIGIIKNETNFYAIDGGHKAFIIDDDVKLEMLDVASYEMTGGDYIINTGSPHYVKFLDTSEEVDVIEFGKSVRYSDRFKEEGINVNIMKKVSSQKVNVATYERGVEDETLSCGTGVTACALVYMAEQELMDAKVEINTKGGRLAVEAKRIGEGFNSIWLTGPATFVFHGSINA